MTEDTWPSDWLRGVLGLAVLRAVADGDTYGYAIAHALRSGGLGTVKGGTLYPLLSRFEQAGLLITRWEPGDGGPGRKHYALTAAGQDELDRRRIALGPLRAPHDRLRRARQHHLGGTAMRRRDVDRYELERTFAPHIDPAWTEAALLELRLLGVRGDRIGAALAEADAFCVDSGQDAAEAFGDPVAYARSLDLPAEADPTLREELGTLGRIGLDVLAVLLLGAAYPAWRRGDELTVTVGARGSWR